jgi:hypothetical protein
VFRDKTIEATETSEEAVVSKEAITCLLAIITAPCEVCFRRSPSLQIGGTNIQSLDVSGL